MPLLTVSLVYFSAVITFLLGFFTLHKNNQSKTHVSFFLFATAIAVYNIFNFMVIGEPDAESALFWVRSVMFVATLINLFFFLFAAAFPATHFQVTKIVVWASVFATVVLAPLAFTAFIFSTAGPHGVNPVPGPGMAAFLLHTVTLLGGSVLLLIKKYRASKGQEKSRIKLLLFGSVTMFAAILVTNVLFVIVLQNVSLAGMLPIYTLIFTAFVTYAITRYRLLNISMLIARSVAFSVVFLIMLGMYSAVLYGVAQMVLLEEVSTQIWLVSSVVALLIAYSFAPLRSWMERVTDSVLYKDKYDSNSLLYELSTIMASTLHLQDLSKKVLNKLIDEMRVTQGAIVLLEKRRIFATTTAGTLRELTLSDTQITAFSHSDGTIVLDTTAQTKVRNALQELKMSVVTRLKTDKGTVGVLLLGEKRSGEVFTDLDVQVISIFAPQVAVAIENARAYEEIRKFNITLKEEVEKATAELQTANDELKELDQLKDEFVSIASHELRTPMTAIKDYLWMALAGKGGKLTEKQEYYLTRSFNATERLIKLVNDLLNISRIESGRVSLEVAKVNLNQVITEVIEEVQARATHLDISIKTVVPLQPVYVVADSDKLKEVLINLLGNSLKFTETGGVVTVFCSLVGDTVTTAVTDTGVGIPAKNIPTLFKKFGLIKGSYKTNQEAGQGTGLGLYISRSIIELHQGKIWAASEGIGKGATFSFTLPLFSKEKLDNLTAAFANKSDAGIIRSRVQ